MRCRSTLLAILLTSLLTAAAGAQEASEWRVGLARVVITPTEPMLMSGYASRQTPSEGVDYDLFAKAIVLEDHLGRRAVLITADLLGFTNEISESICSQLSKHLDMSRDQILLNASHTHAGPMVRMGYLAQIPKPLADAVESYTAKLEDKVVAMVIEAWGKMQPARLSWGSGAANFVYNRREPTPRGIVLGVNPSGPADRTVPVLRVDSPDGQLRAVIFGAAAHNTTLTGQYMRINGDYAGYAQMALEENYSGVQAMFVLGCAGDASSIPRGTVENAQQHGRTLADEVRRVLAGELKPIRGPIGTHFTRIDLPLQEFDSREAIEQLPDAKRYQRYFVQGALAMLERGEALPTRYRAPMALWQFGDDLTLVGICGETMVDYVALMQQAIGPLNLWIAGYCNDVFGYLPTARTLAEGGYETRGIYTGVGLFHPRVEHTVVDSIRRLAAGAGRPMPAP